MMHVWKIEMFGKYDRDGAESLMNRPFRLQFLSERFAEMNAVPFDNDIQIKIGDI